MMYVLSLAVLQFRHWLDRRLHLFGHIARSDQMLDGHSALEKAERSSAINMGLAS